MSAERNRRHVQPRYVPLAPRRSLPLADPNRAEKMHPTWCPCPACNHETPAVRRRGSGCGTGLWSTLLVSAGIAAVLPLFGNAAPTIANVLVYGAPPIGIVLLLFGKHLS